MELLEIKQLNFSYGNREVLHDLSLTVNYGETLAIIGKSGSGKSTLTRSIAGLLDVNDGQILFKGEKLEGPSERLVPGYEEIRLVHQDFKLKHKMTVYENIRYELLSYVEDYQQERINDLLALCRIEHLRDQDIALVSGGEKQRVAIARAMATEPDILLMDEPFSNLDLNTKYTLLEELKVIANTTETTIILITHDARDAMEIADRLIVLEGGRMVREGQPEEIYQQPEHCAVADLIGFYNALSGEQLHSILPDTDLSQNKHFGIWAEDVILGEKGLTGTIQKTVFGGPYNKVCIAVGSTRLWAYDFSRQFRHEEEVVFKLRTKRIFELQAGD